MLSVKSWVLNINSVLLELHESWTSTQHNLESGMWIWNNMNWIWSDLWVPSLRNSAAVSHTALGLLAPHCCCGCSISFKSKFAGIFPKIDKICRLRFKWSIASGGRDDNGAKTTFEPYFQQILGIIWILEVLIQSFWNSLMFINFSYYHPIVFP